MAEKSSLKIDAPSAFQSLGRQFREASDRHDDPSSWPSVPRFALLAVGVIVIPLLLWFVWLRSSFGDALTAAQAREETLKSEYKTKVQRAVSLDALKKQKEQVLQYVNLLEKQLPSKSEMDALLSDINQAGLGRSLQFELFKPSPPVIKEYYAETSIAVKISGRYHDMGAFTADVANLSRIVTLNDITIAPSTNNKSSPDTLVMDTVAKTFRYLDPEEVAAQRAATSKQPGGKK